MPVPEELLGQYLRARRELLSPDQVGIPKVGTRRVPGLRREEVATLAGISADYYLRLEQSRDNNPSRQVLDALARALQLDDDGVAYLLSIADGRLASSRQGPRNEAVPIGMRALVDTIEFPAFVEGRYFDVLEANSLAAALSPRLIVGANRLWDVFLDPAERSLYPDWPAVTSQLVGGFRESVGTEFGDPRLEELVGDLSSASPRFRQPWRRHDVAHREGGTVTVNHPELGALTLFREKFPISGTAGQMFVLYHPLPGERTAEITALLSSAAEPTRDLTHHDEANPSE